VVIDSELVKALLVDLAVEGDTLAGGAEAGFPLPLDGHSDLLASGRDHWAFDVDRVLGRVARVIPDVVDFIRGQGDRSKVCDVRYNIEWFSDDDYGALKKRRSQKIEHHLLRFLIINSNVYNVYFNM